MTIRLLFFHKNFIETPESITTILLHYLPDAPSRHTGNFLLSAVVDLSGPFE